ncbi:DNA repair ATPase [Massilia sp. W12]|uniref:DNA repair ATPase n=1 Tax=Massilia sp. W12 TaxID=3126507 RepID=UPI0030CD028F
MSLPETGAAQDASLAQAEAERATVHSSSFDLLRQRLAQQAEALLQKAASLNQARIDEFGRDDTRLLARTRARTENNCVARDLVLVGDVLLFGYNVFIGLRKETKVADVFALYHLQQAGDSDQFELQALPIEGSFLADPRFVAEFTELYSYYRNTQLVQLRVHQGKLLAAFQIGERASDLRVFRWQLADAGQPAYIDNRGERDIALPPSHDFEWHKTTREQHVIGKHSHINILDTLFVETIDGDLTIKIENNTESGLGIYSEPVTDRNQSLNDAEIAYASVGELILLRIKPYREQENRYLIFNRRLQQVSRIDAIGQSCVQLPEDHGIVFPVGYALQSGESRTFTEMPAGLQFKRRVLSANGEDVLYVFYGVQEGIYVLLSYNLINKTLSQPMIAHGYARFPDGRILLFTAENQEPTRNHPMQLWQTPFQSEEHAAKQVPKQSFLGKIGNRELVRAISEMYSICKLVHEQDASGKDKLPTRFMFESLIKQCRRTVDAYHWLNEDAAHQPGQEMGLIIEVANSTIDEFDKVAAVQRQAQQQLQQTASTQRQLLSEIASRLWQSPTDFVEALAALRLERGRLASMQEQRYIDLVKLAELDRALQEEESRVAERTVQFLSQEQAFAKISAELARHRLELPKLHTSAQLQTVQTTLEATALNLNGLTELLASLAVSDASLRTRILQSISSIFADVNKLRAEVRQRHQQFSKDEAAGEFAAQFNLFAQAVESALEQADTPERCEELLTRLLSQLEEQEGRFAEQAEFLAEIAAKRETVYVTFEARKQSLQAQRAQRVQAITDAAQRVLHSIPKRLQQFTEAAQLEAYFAADALVAKLKSSIQDLRKLGSNVSADDLAGQLKNLREQGQRALRDRTELVSGNTIRLGRHAFTVNSQPLDLNMVLHKQQMCYHLTGTDYFFPVDEPRLQALEAYWQQQSLAESAQVYRAEYLAWQVVLAAQEGREGWTWQLLQDGVREVDGAQLLMQVRQFAAPRYQEGYQKGLHDHDAVQILRSLAPMLDSAGLLRYDAGARALALLYWQHLATQLAPQVAAQTLCLQAQQAELMRRQFGNRALLQQLTKTQQANLAQFVQQQGLDQSDIFAGSDLSLTLEQAASYLLAELGQHPGSGNFKAEHKWVLSRSAADLMQNLLQHFSRHQISLPWQAAELSLAERWQLACAWLASLTAQGGAASHSATQDSVLPEAAAALLCPLPRDILALELRVKISNVLGEHARVQEQSLDLHLNEFVRRLQSHCQVHVPHYLQLQALRLQLLQAEKARLRLEQFQAKPLSSFVRNRLIDDVYLPTIGDNLAKQIGAAGDARRTDSMGMLLLISPPGYGKTTLMEYLADRLGMIFVRINCPVLGHEVRSLDPAQAANSAARMELEKLNLGLAMGNNVMLYLDDIQHTNAEFLQKFIGLADGTRRIEGIWRGASHTYDLRGKRFAIVMAGNPYTESGEMFRIPDMLANRADIYNLGDMLSGHEDVFAMSYIENALVANPVLQVLNNRAPQDVQLLLRMAQGEPIAASQLQHAYSSQEISEICAVLQRMCKVRDAVLAVNQAYIASAAQDPQYRTEPSFKLQGSYRNMAKLAARISALMSPAELDLLLRDHYRGEAQTLTTGAEENLLKLAHLLGQPSAQEQARWRELCSDFLRLRKQGGADADGATKIANLLGDISAQIEAMAQRMPAKIDISVPEQLILQKALLKLTESYEQTLLPMLSSMNHKMRLDHSIWDSVREMSANISELDKRLLSVLQAGKKSGAHEVGKHKAGVKRPE